MTHGSQKSTKETQSVPLYLPLQPAYSPPPPSSTPRQIPEHESLPRLPPESGAGMQQSPRRGRPDYQKRYGEGQASEDGSVEQAGYNNMYGMPYFYDTSTEGYPSGGEQMLSPNYFSSPQHQQQVSTSRVPPLCPGDLATENAPSSTTTPPCEWFAVRSLSSTALQVTSDKCVPPRRWWEHPLGCFPTAGTTWAR